MEIPFKKLDHIQICIPKGCEEQGRAFYCGVLGLTEIEKPDSLKSNGGFWLDIAGIQLHIGTEDLPGVSKRHPAFEVANLIKVKEYLISQGVKIKEDIQVPGVQRFSLYDYWDNRIELLEKD